MLRGTYSCNICNYLIVESLNGDIDGMSLNLSVFPEGTVFDLITRPKDASVHICGPCCRGIKQLADQIVLTQFTAVEKKA